MKRQECNLGAVRCSFALAAGMKNHTCAAVQINSSPSLCILIEAVCVVFTLCSVWESSSLPDSVDGPVHGTSVWAGAVMLSGWLLTFRYGNVDMLYVQSCANERWHGRLHSAMAWRAPREGYPPVFMTSVVLALDLL